MGPTCARKAASEKQFVLEGMDGHMRPLREAGEGMRHPCQFSYVSGIELGLRVFQAPGIGVDVRKRRIDTSLKRNLFFPGKGAIIVGALADQLTQVDLFFGQLNMARLQLGEI